VGSRLLEDCSWIYRIEANPGMPRGGIVPPAPVLAPGSALGSRPRVALSSAQAPPVDSGPRPSGNSGLGRLLARLGRRVRLELPARTRRTSKALTPRRIVGAVRGSMYGVFDLSYSDQFANRRIVRGWIAVIRGHRSVLPPFSNVSFAPLRERPAKYRGARTEVIGKISDTANSAVVLWARYARGDRLGLPDWLCPRSDLRATRSLRVKRP
jgi:hypothetical protein